MLKIYQIIIIVFFILFFMFHSYYYLKVNNDIEILQLDNPTKTILEDTLNKKSPLIITNLLINWSFIKELNLDVLKKNYGDKNVTLNNSIIEQNKTKKINKTFGEYIDWINNLENKEINDINIYLAENDDLLLNTKLIEQIKKETSILNCPLNLVTTYPLWIGHNNSKTGLHYDTDTRNFLCQLKGYKKVYLFTPNQSEYLYPSRKFDSGARCSQVNFWNVDTTKFPLFSQSKYIEIILSPGQILYIPPYWWHCVENIGTNVSISIRSEPISIIFLKLPDIFKLIGHKLKLIGYNNCTCCDNH